MQNSAELDRVARAFAEEAAVTDPEAPVASTIWPTAGAIIDHLGNIQSWAAAILSTGESADVRDHRRPAETDRIAWFMHGASTLVEQVERAHPAATCWTFVGPGRAAFWGRRMVHEATKHLWDLRTAVTTDPPMPSEIDAETPVAIIDEFDEVFIARARRRGIAPLPGPVLLEPTDSPRRWLIETDWRIPRDRPGHASAVLRASVADLALVLWERADPWALPHRFEREGDEHALHALCETPVHL